MIRNIIPIKLIKLISYLTAITGWWTFCPHKMHSTSPRIIREDWKELTSNSAIFNRLVFASQQQYPIYFHSFKKKCY